MTLMTTFFGGRGKGETQPRRRKGETQPRRRSCGFEIRRQKKGSTYFFADLKSASSEVAFLPLVLLADCKSAIVTHTAADCKSTETEREKN